jgi:hypothetical protein
MTVTLFADKRAQNKTECTTTLRGMVDTLTNTMAGTKELLPWLKLAAFGNTRKPGGSSLRHNDNVLSINGIEADYDGEQITLDRARTILQGAGIAAILYTSPSHTPSNPRWRILCPTSEPLAPADRHGLVARVNGLFVGALAGESFTLSQSYYYGRVDGNEHHEVVVVEGKAIDLATELDASAVGKPEHAHAAHVAAQPILPTQPRDTAGETRERSYALSALDGACQDIMGAADGQKHHAIVRGAFAAGGLVQRDWLTDSEVWSALTSALNSLRPYCKDFRAAEKTLRGQFELGKRHPRELPESEIFGGTLTAEERAKHERQFGPMLARLAQMEVQRHRQVTVQQAKPLDVAPGIMDVPGALGMFIDHCERTAISHQPFLSLASAICLIGTLAGRKYRTVTDLRTNIYAVGVADSGAGKDHARKKIKACLSAADLTQYLGGEKLASGQAMLTALNRHPAALFQIDEFGDFLADVLGPKSAPHRKDIAANLKTLYSSAATFMTGTEYADAKMRPRVDIQQPHACLYATTTPGQLWSAIAGNSLHDGLMARVLLFVSPCSYPDEDESAVYDPPPSDLVEALQAIARGPGEALEPGNLGTFSAPMSGKIAHEAHTVPNTPDAEAAYRAMRKEQTAQQRKHEGTYVTAIVGRLAENAMKLALVRAVSRNPADPVIGADDVGWGRSVALHCIDTLLREADRHVADSEYEGKLKRTLDIIRKHGPVTERDMLRKGFEAFQPNERKDILSTLHASGRVTRIEVPAGPKGGRPTIRWAVSQGCDETPSED